MWDSHAFQGAFCAPGFLMSADCFLQSNPCPSSDEVRVELSGHLCRCAGYQSIAEGIAKAVQTLADQAGTSDA